MIPAMPGPARLPRGARVGPFTVRRHLARGGTSDVYEALRDGDCEPVALKVLTGLSAGDRARAEREAAIAARPGCLGCKAKPALVANVWRCETCAIFLCPAISGGRAEFVQASTSQMRSAPPRTGNRLRRPSWQALSLVSSWRPSGTSMTGTTAPRLSRGRRSAQRQTVPRAQLKARRCLASRPAATAGNIE